MHADARGSFREVWNETLFRRLGLGLPTSWPQDNISFSRKGVIRGMHIQSGEPQGKLVQCLQGGIQDVAIDLRTDSPSCGKAFSFVMLGASEEGRVKLFYIPPGFAHGFLALEDSLVSYKCTTLYDPEKDGGVNPLASGINWIVQRDPGAGINGLVSPKDQALPSLVDYLQRT